MEYTALLAGERFTDAPRCVDEELAAVLRGANDRLSDADRPLLVPLLGRAIGLGIGRPPPGPRGLGRAAARYRREVAAPYQRAAARLCRDVTHRFVASLGGPPPRAPRAWSGRRGELAQVFWDSMGEPAAPATSREFVLRLLERLSVLHECYERAVDDLRATRTEAAGPVPAAGGGHGT
ncbi:hypothetical protein [Geodermatophilus aquaeductus]|nr:hypothetical protein [Geodermatophilus aquaeductus]